MGGDCKHAAGDGGAYPQCRCGLLPIFLVCAASTVRGQLQARSIAVAAALLPGVAIILFYFAAFKLAHGQYAGLTNMSGWNLYSRVAPFADCREFTPPTGRPSFARRRQARNVLVPLVTSGTRIRSRGAPLPSSSLTKTRGLRLAGHSPSAGRLPSGGRNRLAALYRTFDRTSARLFWAAARDSFVRLARSIGRAARRQSIVKKISRHQSPPAQAGDFGAYQNLFRVGGLVLAALIVFTLPGMVRSQGQVRFVLFLFGLSGLALYIVPVLTILRFSLWHSGRNLDRRFRYPWGHFVPAESGDSTNGHSRTRDSR